MAAIALRGIEKSFQRTRVLGGVDLDIRDGEFLTLVGPSGCGKSTLLRIIAGLEPQDRGAVAIGGGAVDHLRPAQRNVAMVFQSYALYPHMSVADNIAMPLLMARLSLFERLPLLGALSPRRPAIRRGIAAAVRDVAAQLQLEDLLGRRPAQLSGGQRQRVALGRAMVRQPSAFLMDEPLSNLDARLRVHMRSELAELHGRLGATFVYVTHDQVEAMTMSDRVALMDGGTLLQVGTPADLYDRPASIGVAQFIGSPAINLLPGVVDGPGIALGAATRLAIDSRLATGAAVTVGIRPEALHVATCAATAHREGLVEARLRRIENLGSECLVHCDPLAADAAPLLCRLSAAQAVSALDGLGGGDRIALQIDPWSCHVFDGAGQRVAPARPAVAGPRSRAAADRVA